MTAQPYRLRASIMVEDAETVRFRFDGREYTGFKGDTLASALLANGVHMVARSFKYHRPRGILSAGSEDPAALVQVGRGAETLPNTRATELEIYDGLEAFPQNCWPSLNFDIREVNDVFSRFMPAGFYYKTFFNWMRVEGLIRKSAGLGVCPNAPDPDRYEHVNRHCDVLVVGGGPAGLAAARTVAATGARVILCEETQALGGRLLSEADGASKIDGIGARDWIAQVRQELEKAPDATVLTRTCCFGYHPDNWLVLEEAMQAHLPPNQRDDKLSMRRLWRVRAKQVVLASGAIERPLVFHGNDRPGVMLAGAVRTYIHRYGVTPGRKAVVFANNSSAWETAFDLLGAGAEVAAIIDTRAEPGEALLARARELDVPVKSSSTVVGSRGRKRVRSVAVQEMTTEGNLIGAPEKISCDLLAVSGGWSPNVALFSQSRGKLSYDAMIAGFRPFQSWQAERSVGAANGAFSLVDCLAEGAKAGADAAANAGFDIDRPAAPAVSDSPEFNISPAWMLPHAPSEGRSRAFVDLHNDVTASDLKMAVREGYRSVEHAKRYTTTGMGTDQGKTASVNAFGILSEVLERPIPEVGVTTFRPPFKPISFGAIAGQHVGENFHARRKTPMHDCHIEAGAEFEPVGDWLRARTYPKNGESVGQAVQRESLAARTDAGVLDASTLGKIDIKGPDAREFLNRVYTNDWMKLAPGRCRYGLMLNEDGMVFDDGVTACLADDHFHMTTTTGGAAGVLTWLEDYLQTEWPELKVYLTSVTEQWAVAAICGPKSREIVAELFDDIDPDPATFEFMSWREDHIDGIPVRVFRISFTGELSYEINIPARYGHWLWQQILEAGAPHRITPYGTDAMHLLRAEKGFVIVGQDTDGTVTPHDLGMSWAVKKSGDFIGRRSLSRSDTARDGRRQFVGLLSEEPSWVIPEGAQIIAGPQETLPRTLMIGHVTSSYFSPNLARSISLALIEGGLSRMGETVHVARPGLPPAAATIGGVNFLSEGEGAA